MVVNNPNNWHWVDKNCIDWTRQYFKGKLIGVSVESETQSVAIDKITSVEGDVEVCQRKGKVISLFDIKLVLSVGGTIDDTKVTGSITIPEIAYDSEASDLQFDVSIYNENSENTKIKDLIKKQLLPKLRVLLINFGKDLILTHGSDIQLSTDKVNSSFTKENQIKSQQVVSSVTSKTVTSTNSGTSKSTPLASNVPKYNTSTLHLQPVFNTTAEQLYITLLDRARVAAWTRAPPNLDESPKEGSDYSLFGGNISGKFLTLKPNEQIVMLWRLSNWREGHFAKLDLKFHQGEGETKVEVFWTGIPIGEEENVESNFEEYYVKAIKITFGFGAVL